MTYDARPPRGPVGGAANEAGTEYRRGVAAYFVAHGLNGIPLEGWPLADVSAIVEGVALETDFPVDDLLVRLRGGSLYVQAKRNLDWSLVPEIAVQWVRAVRDAAFNPVSDLLVAIAGSLSGPVGTVAGALDRARGGATSFTKREVDERARLRRDLEACGASETEIETVLRCAVIRELQVEDPGQREATAGRLLLDGHVVSKGEGARAWRELLAIAGDTARLRGGHTVASWLQQLRDRGVSLTVDAHASVAAYLTAREEALQRYRSAVVRRGATIDVTALGIAAPPIPFEEMDAGVDFYRPDDERDGLDPLWSFRRRGRVVLTGLPGSGKSTSVARVAALWASRAEWATPIPVSLRRFADKASFRRRPLLDQLVELASELVNVSDRALVADALQEALGSGQAVLFLDGLDEAADRSLLLVSDIAQLLASVHPETDVLLATRDVAYADTRQLGFVDLRVGNPKYVDLVVTAVLRAIGAVRGIQDVDTWVAPRERWVESALNADPVLRETPLFPVLLASLAADASASTLPHARIHILERAIEDVVRRRETTREPALPGVDPTHHASMLLACFPLIGIALLIQGGSAPRSHLIEPVAQYLVRDWGLPQGVASATAERVLLFWDEAGVFVATGAEKTVAPRLQLLMEVGAALYAAALPGAEARAWATQMAKRPEALETLVLAAAKSEAIADTLIACACEHNDDTLLSASARAVGQGGRASAASRGLVEALSAGVANGGQDGWRAFRKLIKLPIPDDMREDVLRAVDAHYPNPYPAIARGTACLDWAWQPERLDEYLEPVLVHKLPVLEGRRANRGISLYDLSDDSYGRLLEEAVRRLLPSRPDLAPAVAEATGRMSMRRSRSIGDALRESGYGAIADEARARWNVGHIDTFADAPKLENMLRDFLGLVRNAAPPSPLSLSQKRRLAEFGAFVSTLDLNRTDAWPRNENLVAVWPRFLEAIMTLGGFDRGVLASQADILERERAADPSDANGAFWNLMDLHAPAPLTEWERLPNAAETRELMLHILRDGENAARMVAANALQHHPDRADTASMVRTVVDTGPARAADAAVWVYFSLVDDLNVAVSALTSSSRACVRQAVALTIGPVQEGRVTPSAWMLANDPIRQVRLAVVQHFERGSADAEVARSLLEHVAASADPEFTCCRCGSTNPSEATFCAKCRIVVSRPSEIARRALNTNASSLSRLDGASA